MILRLILAILSTYRLAQLVVFDDGPLFILTWLREWADKEATKEQERKFGKPTFELSTLPPEIQAQSLRKLRGPMQSLNDGLHCPYCVGVWAAALCAILVTFPTKLGDIFLTCLAIAGGASYFGEERKMKDFTLDEIKQLCEQSLLEAPTGNSWLDSRYNEQVHYVGHTQPYYRAFYLIAQALKPSLSVELGSWQGTAAAHLAVGNPQGKVITIDIHREDKAAQQRTIEVTQHCPNAYYINGWTIPGFAEPWTTLEQVKVYNVYHLPIDILFIDAWHEYQYANKEREIYFPLLADTALVICDDLADQGGAFPGMGRFWDEMNYEKFHTTSIHPGIPMGFIKYERKTVADDRAANPISQSANPRRMVTKPRRVSRKA